MVTPTQMIDSNKAIYDDNTDLLLKLSLLNLVTGFDA